MNSPLTVLWLLIAGWTTVAVYYLLAFVAQRARSRRAADWHRHTVTAGVTPIRYAAPLASRPSLRVVGGTDQ